MSVTVTIPNDLINPMKPTFSEQLFGLATYAKNSGAESHTKIIDGVAQTIYEGMQADLMPVNIIALVVSVGGSVTGYKSFIKMTKESAENTDVPDYLPNSTKMIELDSEVSKKWSEMTPFHEYTIEGVDYIFKEADAHGLNEGGFIAECYADPDIEVLTVSEFVALRETLFPESTPE